MPAIEHQQYNYSLCGKLGENFRFRSFPVSVVSVFGRFGFRSLQRLRDPFANVEIYNLVVLNVQRHI
jgi:hypothetical protein